MTDLISRQTAIDAIHGRIFQEIVVEYPSYNTYPEYKGKPYFSIKYTENGQWFIGYGTYKPEVLSEYLKEYFMPSAQPEPEKYEYHYDHTDCIWYRPEARNRCPTTCAQYRDGWNDAMNYIFRDGKGYRPYRRDKQYG